MRTTSTLPLDLCRTQHVRLFKCYMTFKFDENKVNLEELWQNHDEAIKNYYRIRKSSIQINRLVGANI